MWLTSYSTLNQIDSISITNAAVTTAQTSQTILKLVQSITDVITQDNCGDYSKAAAQEVSAIINNLRPLSLVCKPL